MMNRLRTVFQFDILFFIFAFYLIGKGLIRREDSILTAESGLGYTLGIVGGSMMLLLLLYPLRKHAKFLQHLGPVRYWFRFHMLLGVAGPVLILYHSNFSLGSTNSNIALFSMLLVAGSGLFGRLFYSKIHDGLYGRKLQLAELQKSLEELKAEQLGDAVPGGAIETIERMALKQRPLLLATIFIPVLHFYSLYLSRKTIRQLSVSAGKQQLARVLKSRIKQYFQAVVRVGDFSVYERLFSLWHVLHIPLFIMMIISGVVHVFAVHIY